MHSLPRVTALPNIVSHATSCLLIVAATWIVYGRAIGFGYVQFDDVDYVVYTNAVREGLTPESILWAFTTFHFGNWHPLTWLSFMLDVSLFGDAAGPKHAVNIFLHACNSILVYVLVFRMVRTCTFVPPLAVGLLFAVHPLHVESVAWVAERKDVLCAFFYLAAMHVHLRFVANPSLSRYLQLQVVCALALLAKPMAVTLPVVLLLLDYWPAGRLSAASSSSDRNKLFLALVRQKLPLIVMAAAVCVLTLLAQRNAMPNAVLVPPEYRLQNAVISYVTYLSQMILPTGLSMLYPLKPVDFLRQFLPALLTLAAIMVVVVRRRGESPWWLVAMLVFLITLLPVIGLVQVGSQAHADRYMYIPSAMLLVAAGVSLAQARGPWRQRASLAAGLFTVFCAFMAWVQVGYWANNYMAYNRILQVTPDSWQGHVGLAEFHMTEGDFATAETHVRAAMSIDSTNAFVHSSLGNLMFRMGDYDGAAMSFRKALAIDPAWSLPMVNLGVSLEHLGRRAEALDWYCRAMAVSPDVSGIAERIKRLGVGDGVAPAAPCEQPDEQLSRKAERP